MTTGNWFQHTIERRRGLTPRNQMILLAVVGTVLTLVLGGLYLSQVVSFATTNREIEELIADRDRLERENEQLRAQVAGINDIPNLTTQAEDLGFRPATPEDIQYLVVEGYNPDRERRIVPLFEGEDEQLPVYDQTFGNWLEEQLRYLQQQFEAFGRGE